VGQSRGLYLFLWKRKRKSSTGNRIFVHHRIVTAVTRVDFISHRASHTDASGISVLNVHAPSEEKRDDSKDSFMRD